MYKMWSSGVDGIIRLFGEGSSKPTTRMSSHYYYPTTLCVMEIMINHHPLKMVIQLRHTTFEVGESRKIHNNDHPIIIISSPLE